MTALDFPSLPLDTGLTRLRPRREPDIAQLAIEFADPVVQHAAVGYWVAAGMRGRGLASGAVRLLARWAVGELGLARISLTCGPDNKASQRVAARCGFVREGVLRSHVPFRGGRRDSVVFGLLPGELHAADQRRALGE